MDTERHLISAIIDRQDLTPVSEAGLPTEAFLDLPSREVFRTIIRHKGRYGSVPSVSALKANHPDYKLVKPGDPIDYLVDEVRKAYNLSQLEQGLFGAVDAFQERQDPTEIVGLMTQTLSEVSRTISVTRDTDLTKTGDDRYARYQDLMDLKDGLRGIPSGFSVIDRATLGAQPQQLITLIGLPKAGKSTVTMLMSIAAHLHGVKPLFVGFEMANSEQEERYDSIRANISHNRLRSGRLKKEEWTRLERSLKELAEMQPFLLSSDSASAMTVTGIAAKIDTYKPDICFVDGVYMMDDELGEAKMSPQALTNITRGLKRLAQNTEIPIVISTQALNHKVNRRTGVDADAIGYSSSFAQDSDVIIAVEQTEDANINKLRVVMSRNSGPAEVFVQWDWETGQFTELEGDPFEGEGEGDDDDGWKSHF